MRLTFLLNIKCAIFRQIISASLKKRVKVISFLFLSFSFPQLNVAHKINNDHYYVEVQTIETVARTNMVSSSRRTASCKAHSLKLNPNRIITPFITYDDDIDNVEFFQQILEYMLSSCTDKQIYNNSTACYYCCSKVRVQVL